MKKRMKQSIPSVVSLCIAMTSFSVVPAFAGSGTGDILRAYLNKDLGRFVIDLGDVQFTNSVELELYSGTKKLTTSKLDTSKVIAGNYGELTGAICVDGKSNSWTMETWTAKDREIPDTIKLVVDGVVVDTYNEIYATVEGEKNLMTEKDWKEFPGTEADTETEVQYFSVVFHANGGTNTMENQMFTYNVAQALMPNAFIRTGYRFVGWNTSTNGSGISYTDGMSVKNLTDVANGLVHLYAQWELMPDSETKPEEKPQEESKKKYDIIIDDNIKHGDIDVDYSKAKEDTTVTIEVDPDKGYKLDELTVFDEDDDKIKVRKKSSEEYTFKMPSSDVTIDATFEKTSADERYDIDIKKNLKHGSLQVDRSTAKEGTTVKITVKPDKGYQLEDIVIRDRDKDKVKLREESKTEFSFKMPDSDVVIDASFETADDTEDISEFENQKKNAIVLTIGQRTAWVFGDLVINDVSPVIRNGRTMLPARIVANNLGANIKWNQTQRKATITKNNLTIQIFIDSSVAYVNGKAIALDSPAFVENGRTYLPIKFISQYLGADVHWDAEKREVWILPKK